MSFRNSAIAFGVSVTALVGGAYGLAERSHYEAEHATQEACIVKKYAGNVTCLNTVVTPEIAQTTEGTANIYGWMAGLGLIGGGLGLAGVWLEARDGSGENDSDEEF